MRSFPLNLLTLVMVLIGVSACSVENRTARNAFHSEPGSLLVCPVHILDNQASYYDTVSSRQIIQFINENGYAHATSTTFSPPPYKQWIPNEAKMLTRSIELFADSITALQLPEETYMLYAEFLKGGAPSRVRAVHYSILNGKGELVMRGLLNSLWEEFQAVKPETHEDCVEVFKNGFTNKMAEK